MSIVIKNMQMPSCCNECPMLDDNGDYPFCILTKDQRGYTFDTLSRRMDSCPLEDANEALSLVLYTVVTQNKIDISWENY